MKQSTAIIVEDSVLTVFHLEMLLKSHNCEIVSKHTRAEELAEAVREHQPDFILLDIMLAGDMLGIDAAREVRKFSQTPIIFISALSDQVSIEDVEAIPNAYQEGKPFVEKRLLALINSLIDK